MPFVLLSAFGINGILEALRISGGTFRLVLLGSAFPLGFLVGRLIYMRRSHIEIILDDSTFRLLKGSKEIVNGFWRDYQLVSLAIDQFGKPNLRLYKTVRGEYLELPTSRTNADPQRFRDHVQGLITKHYAKRVSPQVAEAA